MFGRLGEVLTIYYFPEEYDEVVNTMRTRMTNELCASRTVLGIGFDVLGVEVARREPVVLNQVPQEPADK